MILSAADVASAARWSAIWEFCEYASEGLVCLGCVGEYVAEYTKWRTEDARHSLGRRSLLILIFGLGTGLFSLIKTNALAGLIIGSLGEQVERAGEKAERVSGALEMALSRATQAEMASSNALANSTKAQRSASEALTLARGARQEADTFEKDIKTARKEAADALANLAQAKQLAEEAQQATSRNTEKLADRVLSSTQQANIAAQLRRFGTRRIDVIIIGDGREIANITDLIGSAMQQAGWTVHFVGKAISGPNASGVLVGTHIGSDQDTENAANGLVSALQAERIASDQFVPQFDDKLPMAIVGNWDEKNVAPIRMLVFPKP